MTKVLAIVGPTAVGKTELSLKMAKELNGEIISGDSMQVYKHLDIGTAKILPKEMQGITHHLINIREINERFSVSDFQSLANKTIDDIVARGKQPIVVGGTGFYVQSLVENLALGNDQFDSESEAIRAKWHAFADLNGKQQLWDHLNDLDHKAAVGIPVNNDRRVIRALEVIEKTGHLFSDQIQKHSTNEFKLIGLNTDRKLLYNRINQRVNQMLDEGLQQEARWLYDQNGVNFQSGKGIGYRELFDYFDQKCDFQTAVEKIKQDSRHYAKRQLTWFRNKMDVTWFNLVEHTNSVTEINQIATEWLRK
ncbi:tRNA (adenosine(37)-N6)-dimethylallyltransferase MiaA [Paucilactobacillus suebicus]|uniref:tRNA dimethylallyltransferase n=1 Tax=Paucilactobacillus suebicus DSM 5007 = KCTC 3549 TaxID=1423807 RepID=A0A0R1W709_9LACO|nr:tRNA (adenosine(37)-N6)-dimethylallyltransferase MiaA [Paucilactobacillus suebicus]KRM13205.1 tRNA delta(2)-isopentenylpyrophosphate transferase [Paucilactobacillus suebicus DSM 5007 = KCTC 3549]